MLRKITAGVAMTLALVLAASPAMATDDENGGGHDPVTICHKPGTPAEKTLTVDDDAVQAHLDHGDYLGECQEPPEDLHRYRVVAGMPRYRGEVFEAPDGLACHGALMPVGRVRDRFWSFECGDHVDTGVLRDRTYVRLRDRTDGSVVVLLDLR